MKIIKNLLLISLLALGVQLAVAPQPASALTRAQKVACVNNWDGKVFTSPDYRREGSFKKSDCYRQKGGNCTLTTRQGAPDDSGRRTTVHEVNCNDPRKPAGSCDIDPDDGVKDLCDPAAGANATCTTKDCPLIRKYINPLIGLLSALVGIVAVIAIVWGGILVTTSAGDPQRSAAGKNHIRNAVLGVLAYIFLYSFLRFIVLGNDL